MEQVQGQISLPWVRYRVDILGGVEGYGVSLGVTIEYGPDVDDNDPTEVYLVGTMVPTYSRAVEVAGELLQGCKMRVWGTDTIDPINL
jgi:hypothetical protein